MPGRSVVIFASLSKWWQNIAILIQIGNGVKFWPLIPTVSLINMHLQLPKRLGERDHFIFREASIHERQAPGGCEERKEYRHGVQHLVEYGNRRRRRRRLGALRVAFWR